MKINWSADLIHFLQTAWIPIVEVTAGILIGPRVKKMIVKAADKSQDKGLMTFLGSTANIAIIALSFIMAAEALGIKVSSIVSLVSALGLGVALALKGNMANVAGGIQILVTKPFKIGDYIQVAGHRGYVTTIELMFTTIRTDNQKEAVIPNATIVEDTITNYTKYPYVRVKVPFSVAVGNDMTKIRTEALELMKQNTLLEKASPATLPFGRFLPAM
ncbi:mechanosensitive ion channel family protein [Allobaculum sp. Allo2]|uniref:mechanosensitive ion channel family protein n=1 Tax=Allobaculum sp. Allo2 TaxID=2853432 RepID=UPI001F60B07A|nr:mechanosensitive ion channel domain-containing protein [Allobaculum sp. Allo2]UNT92468.1 mechanosensitive ion channel family protein [Allobaculum sp. Allo2]